MADSVRYPAVADSFYPADKKELEKMLGNFFAKAKKFPTKEKPRILIVPHAGIIYSGQTAAFGFKQLQGWHYSRVFLLGASHHFFFDYAAVSSAGFWQTPLGKTAVDIDFAKRLVDRKRVILEERPHLPEHDLEVELIFLQKILKDFKIVPILVSKPTDETVVALAKKLEESFDSQTLLVVSTDLSHYPPAKVAEKVDKETITAILTGKRQVFEKKVKEVEEKNLQHLDTAICGFEAVRVGLKFSELLGLDRYQLVDYCHSGQVSGDSRQVVGYGSIIGLKKTLSSSLALLKDKEKKEAVDLARATLKSYFQRKKIPKIKIKTANLKKTGFGVFVTLKKNNQLQGCIGEFAGKDPLYLTIEKTALKSAFSDPRFLPLTEKDLDDLEIEISILSPLKEVDDYRKIRVGRDGVVVRSGLTGGTFLPQVADKTDWNLEEFLSSLCADKAGLSKSCYLDPKTEIFIFQTQVF